jgi:hypothetical protein
MADQAAVVQMNLHLAVRLVVLRKVDNDQLGTW